MICLFEDHLTSNFYPFSLTHHLSDLLVGAHTLRGRAEMATGDGDVVLHGRRYIREHRAATGRVGAPDLPTTFLNARVPFSAAAIGEFPDRDQWIGLREGTTIAARLLPETIALLNWDADALDFSALRDIPTVELSIPAPYEYLWDLIYDNGAKIAADFHDGGFSGGGVVMDGAHLVAPEKIVIGAGSVVKPGCVIDASGGPVIIGRDVEVMPNAVIEGPCAIGDGTRIKVGAKIYEGTSIGPRCKIGGEVENSIIVGYSNKQHDGFLGHSYLGEWVNLGADTNTSDLKNNYGAIRVVQDGREVGTGRMFLGSLIGDHSKTGINTMLNTGTVIGVAANIFGAGFPAKSIPSFAWGGFEGGERFRLEDAVELARRVAARRGVEFGPADERLLRYLYERSR